VTQEKKELNKFLDWAAKQPASTPEEKATAEAARKSVEGKWFQTVTMNDDKSLMLVSIQYFEDGGSGHGSSELRPGDPNYDELLREHGCLTPGKAHTLFCKMVDGKWEILPESDEVIPFV
jgi:hypothetical protein